MRNLLPHLMCSVHLNHTVTRTIVSVRHSDAHIVVPVKQGLTGKCDRRADVRMDEWTTGSIHNAPDLSSYIGA